MAGRIQDGGAAGPRRGSGSTGGRGGRAHRAPPPSFPSCCAWPPAALTPHRFLLPSPPLQALSTPTPARAPQAGDRPLPGRGQRAALPARRPGRRPPLLFLCLPPLPLSCRLAPCSSAPSCTCHLPALQPADERSWVYSPLHYSTQAPPASDGESDTVSVPTARQPGPADAPRTDGETPSGAGGQARPPPAGWPTGSLRACAQPSRHSGSRARGISRGARRCRGGSGGERAGWPLPVAPSPTLLPSAVIAVRSPTLSAAPAATLATSWRRCPPSSARDTGGAARPRWTSHAHALP